jgi:hypothetical protein
MRLTVPSVTTCDQARAKDLEPMGAVRSLLLQGGEEVDYQQLAANMTAFKVRFSLSSFGTSLLYMC